MKLLVTHICVLLCLSMEVRSGWSPKVEKVLGEIQISFLGMKAMLREDIVAEVPNCGEKFGHESSNVLSPSEECDQTGVNNLKKGFDNYNDFNVQAFMDGFWGSTVGVKLLKYFEKKGVSNEDLRGAMDEFWFTKSDGVTAFKSVFFDSGETNNHFRYNSWYTYDMAAKAQQLKCRTEKSSRAESTAVQISCPEVNHLTTENGDNKQGPFASFPYPSHPYNDMIYYTLCAWSNIKLVCVIPTPGGKHVNIQVDKSKCSEDNYDCLKSVYVY